jgi:Fur family ferric uptake transcriptional regulator
VEIDLWNQRNEGTAINLMSIIVGNGVMAFDTLQRSTYEYMIDRKFVDPEIEALQEAIARRLGYRLVDHRLELYGLPINE